MISMEAQFEKIYVRALPDAKLAIERVVVEFAPVGPGAEDGSPFAPTQLAFEMRDYVQMELLRLETKGLVASQIGEPTPERGGRRKKHYAISAAGRRSLSRSLTALSKLSRGIAPLWEAP